MITTRIAFIVLVEDYHEIGYIANAIQGVELSWCELGMYGKDYVGLIYNEYSPGDAEIAGLLLGAEIELEDRL